MKPNVIVLFILSVFSCLPLHGQEEYYFRFELEDREKLDAITRLISIDNVKDSTVYAYALKDQLQDFKRKTGYSLELLNPPCLKATGDQMVHNIGAMQNWNRYPTYEVYAAMMDSFATAYPGICELDTIGTTVENRAILAAHITDQVNEEENEPEVFYTSTMHGNETAGYVLMLRLIDTLLSAYQVNPDITDIINRVDLYINPNANPDGTYAGGNNTLSGATRYNANGKDLNRNFPDPQDGLHPDGAAWQPETKAMMDFASQHSFVLSANFHGGAEVVNYPWDTWSRDHADNEWLKKVSLVYADATIENSPEGYFTELSSNGVIQGYDWYPISGGRQDYMTYFQHSREVTIEISNKKLPASDQLPDLWNANRKSLLQFLQQCMYGIHGVVKDNTGKPLYAKVEILQHDCEADSSVVFTDPDYGDYHRLIMPGTYDLVFSAGGYRNDTLKNVALGNQESLQQDVTLQPVASGLSGESLSPNLNASGNTILCYPNPFKRTLYVQIATHEGDQFLAIKDFNSQGQCLKSVCKKVATPGATSVRLDFTRSLPSRSKTIHLLIRTHNRRFSTTVYRY